MTDFNSSNEWNTKETLKKLRDEAKRLGNPICVVGPFCVGDNSNNSKCVETVSIVALSVCDLSSVYHLSDKFNEKIKENWKLMGYVTILSSQGYFLHIGIPSI